MVLYFIALQATLTPNAPLPTTPVSTYIGCIRKQAETRSRNSIPIKEIDAVMTACEPLAADAARTYAETVQNDPPVIDAQAKYIQKYGKAPDLIAGSYRTLHRMARDGALQILAGVKGQVNVETTFDLETNSSLAVP